MEPTPSKFTPNRNWYASAACKGCDPELFFPRRGDDVSSRSAKRVCATCPVKIQCLDFAISNHEHFGIWGGVSDKGRRKLAAQRRQDLAATG